MKLAHRLVGSALALALGALPTALSGQANDMSQVQIIPHQVTGGIYYLQGQGGNIGLSVGEDGVVMIDDQFAPLTERILAAIRQINPGEIRFLINTHVHGDHTGGNENLGRMGILILARDAVRVRLMATAPAVALPVLTFSEPINIHLNGEQVRTIPVAPAHTDGDSFIHFVNSDVLHMGDVYRTTGYPYMDLANGGSLNGLLEALGIAIGLAGPNTKIIPGHGAVATRAQVIAHRDMILDVKARVVALIAQGLTTYDQVAAARPTAAYDAGMDSPERFLRALVTELGGS
ncbi:MAG: MBL fold metallo-hydrolase [Gemmatimonadetes bacterium]|nr:MBL fold metallo-hydrolase [Gemmatimonadota bacterium]